MSISASTDESITAVVGSRITPGNVASRRDSIPAAGELLGRYLVIEELGRGGMGVVLRAYDPKLQREVAIKRVAGRLSESAQARLVREARAMARLNHPNVVAVFDVELADDSAATGVLVVMEYVRGVTLRRWLDDASPSWRAIVDAFISAGRGLSAAHAQDLLHRDFKLDNVLVGDDARVRVTDFGLARATASRASSDAIVPASEGEHAMPSGDGVSVELTQDGVVMGTPSYMAPEQTEGAEIDARCDQYAFCIALWRALTKRWPFEGSGRALLAAKRAGPPRWPGDIPVPRHVVEAVRRGLAPDPSDRFPSLVALLDRLARDPTRSRRGVLAVGGLVVAGLGLAGIEQFRAVRDATACADEGARIFEVWNEERADAIGEAFAESRVADAPATWTRARAQLQRYADEWHALRVQTCTAAEIERALPPAVAEDARACLDEHAQELDALLERLRPTDARIVHKTAIASHSLPRLVVCTDEARLRHRQPPPEDEESRARMAELRSRLADAAAAHAMGKYDEARELAAAVVDAADAASLTALAIRARTIAAQAHASGGKDEDAIPIAERAFFDAGAAGRDELALRAASLLVYTTGHALSRHDEGVAWGRIAEMLVQRLGLQNDVVGAGVFDHIGLVYSRHGDHARAIALHERARSIWAEALGEQDLKVAVALNNLGLAHDESGKHEEAIGYFERALAIYEPVIGSEHPDYARSLANCGNAYFHKGDRSTAIELWKQSLAIRERALGPNHPDVATPLSNLGGVYRELGQHDEARAMLERALAIWEQAFGPDHPQVAAALGNLGNVHAALGDKPRALELYQRAASIMEETLGPEHPELAVALNNLAGEYDESGDHERAIPIFVRSLAIFEASLGPEHPTVALARENLAQAHLLAGDFAPAREHYAAALAIRERVDTEPAQLAATRFGLARALIGATGERAPAVELATAARNGYATAGAEHARAREEVERWLAEHARDR